MNPREVPATYEDAVSFLFGALPMYQREGKAAYKADLGNSLRLDEYFGHPHRAFRSIHVAGTNGKGSVSHMLAAVFQQAGYRTGLYTSPHLIDFRERIRINGDPVPAGEVVRFVRQHMPVIRETAPSFFEMTVAMAFDYFARNEVEIALVETGLGGRLDSTNIITPVLSVITNISMDHTEFLGHTPAAIAREKAGIIKERIPVVIGKVTPHTEPVFRSVADANQAPLHLASRSYAPLYPTMGPDQLVRWRIRHLESGMIKEIRTDLAGHYQSENLVTALTVVDLAREMGWDLPHGAVEQGLSRVARLTGLLGRWQTLSLRPRVICDTAHNPDGVEAVMSQVLQVPCRQLHIVWGMVGDKDPATILPLLPGEARYYFTRSSVPRAMPEKKLKESAALHGLEGPSYPTVAEACRAALESCSRDDFLFVGGSTFVVADLLSSGIF